MNFNEMAKNLEMEEEEFKEIVKLFLDTTYADLTELQSAIKENDNEKVAKTAHSIKGASINIGFSDIYEVAKSIESMARLNNLKRAMELTSMIKDNLKVIYEKLYKNI